MTVAGGGGEDWAEGGMGAMQCERGNWQARAMASQLRAGDGG